MSLDANIRDCFKGYTALANAVDALTQADLDALVEHSARASQMEGAEQWKEARAAWNRFDSAIGILREKIAACHAARNV